ncbi:hypothetical protein CPT03_00525 [Pedobacter ginsengisoli]|uniref:Ig-like domain-containing protein n=1 Tax=Pedobacter ginsengisoli TaxID=363852 RepID=A0A2D1U0B0_9SPHI|nr:gliding motility-associated C-terminal domain-containing protein [Pedobacter ginsengisoli]ATP55055.1 hypothetical protein CPT03_00525 [Pedobacter ginsengisoli]
MRFTLILILLCLNFNAFSNTFVVTSNADSGVGTLRDALQKAAANGVSEKDYIHFNLPGSTEIDRTVVALTPLPLLSSNLVIDGTTQPNGSFGVTNSRVRIFSKISQINDRSTLKGDAIDNLEIYGLWINNLYEGGTSTNAIEILNSGKIIIGGNNKGNFFQNGITISKTKEFIFKSNVCFSSVDGNVGNWGRIYLEAVDKILIGGNENEGNMIAGVLQVHSDQVNISDTRPKYIDISYNNIGANYARNHSDRSFGVEEPRIEIQGSFDNGQPIFNEHHILIKKNVIAACNSDVVIISAVSGTVAIQGNSFNTDLTGTLDFSPANFSFRIAIVLSTKAQCLIGGDNEGDGNIINAQINGVYDANFPEGTCKVSRNRMFCLYGLPFLIHSDIDDVPVVEITSSPFETLSGTATPGADVELFYDDACSGCTPEIYLATVKSDANGKWIYLGSISGAVVASATLNNQTSLFTEAALNMDGLKVINASCGLANGSISGIESMNSQVYKWVNELGTPVGDKLNITRLKPGKYKLILGEGNCSKESPFIDIKDLTPVFDDRNIIVTNSSCGQKNGSIKNLLVGMVDPGALKLKWLDKNNQELGTSADLVNVPSGEYILEARYSGSNCIKTYGPVVLTNQSGPSIDLSGAIFKNATCGGSNGSITNVKVAGTGSITYTWKNAAGVTVGTTKDLINVQSGWYVLEVKDGTACLVLGSAPVQVKETNGITIDEANAKLIPVACNSTSGGITGLIVTGATTYKWMNQANLEVGHSLNLTGIGVGKYHLLASNASGCTKQSLVYEVKELPSTLFDVQAVGGSSAYCNQSNGTISIKVNGLLQPLGVRWVNASGTTVGNSMILTALAGSYKLYLTDNNNCESFYREFSILNVDPAVINRGEEKVTNDQCNLGKGSIKAPGISGIPPYSYFWSDNNGQQIGSGPVLENISAGNYSLTISDALVCSKQTILYTVLNEEKTLLPPILNDLKICAPGDAFIQVMQPGIGTYVLYNENGIRLDQSKSGTFKVNILNSQNYFISQVVGLCESPTGRIRVTIENEGLSKVPNAISPNNDGHNDIWLIPDMINYPKGTVFIFNRYGQKVFASTGYKQPFDGRQNGKDLPVGTYYYIIDLKRACGLLKGSITIIR